MKFFLLLGMVFLFINAEGQLWKEYADSAKIFQKSNDIDNTLEYYSKAKNTLGADSIGTLNYSQICYDMGLVYFNIGVLDTTEQNWLKTKEIKQKIYGQNHLEFAAICNDIGVLYDEMGKYDKSEVFYLEAIRIREKELGKDHLQYAASCNNLANLYNLIGLFKKAEVLTIGSKNIREKRLGKEHLLYAASCNNLANVYWYTGQFDKAEPLYIEALQIREKKLGKEHPDYAQSCNNLAVLYINMGQYEKAEQLLLETQEIWGKQLGVKHPDYALTINNLANFYQDMERYATAELLLKEAKQIREEALGKDNLDYGITCVSLGELYYETKKYGDAEKYLLEAETVLRNSVGKNHPDYASCITSLGLVYAELNQYEKSEAQCLEAKKIKEDILGSDHPNLTGNFNQLAILYWNMKNNSKAKDFFQQMFLNQKRNTEKIFMFTSEKEKHDYLKSVQKFNKTFLSFKFSGSQFAQGDTYDIVLSNRNPILSYSQQLHINIENTTDTIVKRKYSDWINNKEQLAFWYTKPLNERPDYFKSLEKNTNTLEKDIARLLATFKDYQEKKMVHWNDIKEGLKHSEASIEFVEFEYFNGKRWTDSIFYTAVVLRKDKPQPELVYLFEKKQLDSALNVKANTYNSRIDKLYSTPGLYNLIWKPLESKLAGISTVYFASAGQLHLINLAALSTPESQTIADKYRLVQVNTTASIVNPANESFSTSDNILLYGGIKYTTDSGSLIQAAKKYTSDENITRSTTAKFNGPDVIADLPNSEIEVDEIDRLAKQKGYHSKIFKGVEANEESLKAMSGKKSPSILHIVTHGFFNTDPVKLKNKETLVAGKAFALSDDPLMRSGLMMAGANNVWMGKPIKGIEDGVLTGYEVSNMYLPNTRLVVLSACETALGQVHGSEGVYGLQRAFKIAGVENLLMSLWQVPDNTTAEFMQIFYQQLFEKKSVSEAFYFTQKTMRNKYRGNPHKWAGMILIQ